MAPSSSLMPYSLPSIINNDEPNKKRVGVMSEVCENKRIKMELDDVTIPKEIEHDMACAIFQLGLKNSTPKKIIELMPNYENLSSTIIKSHLQKYRLRSSQSTTEEFLALYQDSLEEQLNIGIKLSHCNSSLNHKISDNQNQTLNDDSFNQSNNDQLLHAYKMFLGFSHVYDYVTQDLSSIDSSIHSNIDYTSNTTDSDSTSSISLQDCISHVTDEVYDSNPFHLNIQHLSHLNKESLFTNDEIASIDHFLSNNSKITSLHNQNILNSDNSTNFEDFI
eukprot:gene3715-7382_t